MPDVDGFENYDTCTLALTLKNEREFYDYHRQYIHSVNELEKYCKKAFTYHKASFAPKHFKSMNSFLNNRLEAFLDNVNYQEVFDFLKQE